MGSNLAGNISFFLVCVTELPSMVLAANIFTKLSEYRNMDYRTHFKKTIGLAEYRISGRQGWKTIKLSDIGYQTQTIGLADIRYKKLSIAQLWENAKGVNKS
jgi:hypothetical protein